MKRNKSITVGIELIDDPEWMGGTLYLRNLALCLGHLPAEIRPGIRLLGNRAIIQRFRDECGNPSLFENQRDNSAWIKILRKFGWHSAPAKPIDVLYPGFGADIPGAVTMRWIPDLQHCHLPKLFSAEEIKARDRSIGTIAGAPGVVVFSSEAAASDFRRFFPGYRATPRVWHFHSLIDLSGNTTATDLRNRYGVPEKFVYLPNQFWAHKNHITVLKALTILRKTHGLTVPLVCTGAHSDRRNERHFGSLVQYMRQEGITDQVWLLGLLPRSEQLAILRCSAAVIQPSLFEGWSTVVEDTRAVGRPIFLSDIPVHREQAPRGAQFFSAESEMHLAALIANRWSSLGPGPDFVAELGAKQHVADLVYSSALAFCEIARDALSLK